jgi:hypothetical protein
MRIAICLATVALLVGVSPSFAGQRGRGQQQDLREDGGAIHGDVHVVFSTGDVRVLREYYAPQYRNLPPGLQKKLNRTGQLPPGWQKKVQPFPLAVERQLVVLRPEYRRGLIDGNAVIYAPRTGVIIDATVLF